jgi:hypothetical protein
MKPQSDAGTCDGVRCQNGGDCEGVIDLDARSINCQSTAIGPMGKPRVLNPLVTTVWQRMGRVSSVDRGPIEVVGSFAGNRG